MSIEKEYQIWRKDHYKELRQCFEELFVEEYDGEEIEKRYELVRAAFFAGVEVGNMGGLKRSSHMAEAKTRHSSLR